MSEPRPPFGAHDVETLFASLACHGGEAASYDRVAYFIGKPPARSLRFLQRLGVEVRIAAPIRGDIRQANKLRMLDDSGQYDILIALDTDILVTGDLTRFLNGNLRAKPVDIDPIDEWPDIFRAARLPLPTQRVKTTIDGKETIPYFNSGVLFVPAILVDDLREEWLARLEMPMLWASVVANPFTRDQIALTLALQTLGIAVDPLPVAANFPTHVPIVEDADGVAPVLVHHHQRLSRKGDVLGSGYRRPDAAIAAANAAVRTLRRHQMPHNRARAAIQRRIAAL